MNRWAAGRTGNAHPVRACANDPITRYEALVAHLDDGGRQRAALRERMATGSIVSSAQLNGMIDAATPSGEEPDPYNAQVAVGIAFEAGRSLVPEGLRRPSSPSSVSLKALR